MPTGKAVVVGATGTIGTRLVDHLLAADWQVVGLCRTPPQGGGAAYMSVDLLDGSDCRAKLGGLRDASHLFYAARAKHGEGGEESVSDNMAMLRNVVEALEGGALRHVHLVHGGKYYGLHLGPYKTPAKEDDPRHMPPDFYYDQQDYVAARAGPWTWTISRPPLVYDFAPGRARNLISVIAVYAAISRELGLPLSFPGSRAAYGVIAECVAAAHLVKAIAWMATTGACANQAFNITNGDCFRWENLWPGFASYFDLPLGPVRKISLAHVMADKAPVWDRIVERHGLKPTPYEDMALWSYGDFVFAPDYDVLTDTTKARLHGFHDVVDSQAMFIEMFDRYRAARLIP